MSFGNSALKWFVKCPPGCTFVKWTGRCTSNTRVPSCIRPCTYDSWEEIWRWTYYPVGVSNEPFTYCQTQNNWDGWWVLFELPSSTNFNLKMALCVKLHKEVQNWFQLYKIWWKRTVLKKKDIWGVHQFYFDLTNFVKVFLFYFAVPGIVPWCHIWEDHSQPLHWPRLDLLDGKMHDS